MPRPRLLHWSSATLLLLALAGCGGMHRDTLAVSPRPTLEGVGVGDPVPGWVHQPIDYRAGALYDLDSLLVRKGGDAFEVTGAGGGCEGLLVAPKDAAGHRRITAILLTGPEREQYDERFRMEDLVKDKGLVPGRIVALNKNRVSGVRATQHPGVSILESGGGTTALLIGPTDVAASGLLADLLPADSLEMRVASGDAAIDIDRARDERWTFARSQPLIGQLYAIAKTLGSWMDNPAPSSFAHELQAVLVGHVDALFAARHDDWIAELSGTPFAAYAETAIALKAWGKTDFRHEVTRRRIERRDEAGCHLAAASELDRALEEFGGLPVSQDYVNMNVLRLLYPQRPQPTKFEFAMDAVMAELLSKNDFIPGVRLASFPNTFFPIALVKRMHCFDYHRQIPTEGEVAVAIAERGAVQAKMTTAGTMMSYDLNPAYEAQKDARKANDDAIGAVDAEIDKTKNYVHTVKASKHVNTTEQQVNRAGDVLSSSSVVSVETYDTLEVDENEKARYEQAVELRTQLVAKREQMPKFDAILVEAGRVDVLDETFTGWLDWTVTLSGLVDASFEIHRDVATLLGERHRNGQKDDVIRPESVLNEVRLSMIDEAGAKLGALVAPLLKDRLERHLATISDPALRAEEEEEAGYWLGVERGEK